MMIDHTKPQLYEFSDGTQIKGMRPSGRAGCVAVRSEVGPPWLVYNLSGEHAWAPTRRPTIVLKATLGIDWSRPSDYGLPCGARVATARDHDSFYSVTFDKYPVSTGGDVTLGRDGWYFLPGGASQSGRLPDLIKLPPVEAPAPAPVGINLATIDLTKTPLRAKCGAKVVSITPGAASTYAVGFDRRALSPHGTPSRGWYYTNDGRWSGSGNNRSADLEFDNTPAPTVPAGIDWSRPTDYGLPCGARVVAVRPHAVAPHGRYAVDFDRNPAGASNPHTSNGFLFHWDGTHEGGGDPRLAALQLLAPEQIKEIRLEKTYTDNDGSEIILHTVTAPGRYPVVGSIRVSDTWVVLQWTAEGRVSVGNRHLIEKPPVRYQPRGATVVDTQDGNKVIATCASADQAADIAKGLNL